ncbi:unnamed protein product [Sphagnum tenellum]
MLPSLSSDAMTTATSLAMTTLRIGSPLLDIVLTTTLRAGSPLLDIVVMTTLMVGSPLLNIVLRSSLSAAMKDGGGVDSVADSSLSHKNR